MKHFRFTSLAVAVAMFLTSLSTRAAEPRQYAVEVSATVSPSPAKIQLSWPFDSQATGYTVSRKTPVATAWTAIASLPGTATGYADSSVVSGGSYEYRIAKNAVAGAAHGYILAGIESPLVDNRGKVILLVDSTHASGLASELVRLQQDLAGDGWTVIRRDVSPAVSAPAVKNIIKTEYASDPSNVKAVFIFGHIAVPRSGNINPDGHPDHQGAWAADAYYADMDGAFTDSVVNTTAAERAINHNVPGDGRFDQNTIPTDLELAVGRVDLSNMTCFSNKTPARSELDLLRQYLNKDHNFRHGKLNVPRRGVICDNFGDIYGEAFAATGWRNFAPMFGPANVSAIPGWTYFSTLSTNAYLWSYATGGGSYYTCNGVGGSDDFAINDVKTVFTMLFGSYFGDWDNESNFMRAILGSTSHALTVSWAGRPHWFYHHMALGETIGHSARLSQNNRSGGTYERQNVGTRSINNALLGDPTLRMHPVKPVSNLGASQSGSSITLTWTQSPDTAIRGSHIYRSASPNGPFTRLTATPITGASFTDNAPLASGVYMVRAVKLESSASGTYYNASQGVFHTVGSPAAPAPSPAPAPVSTGVLVKTDVVTGGNWPGIFGVEGYSVNAAGESLPAYVSVSSAGDFDWVWDDAPVNSASPLRPGATQDRIASCWYSYSPYTMDFTFNDGKTHRLSAYFMDYDSLGRQQKVELIDANTGAVLNTQTLANFANGVYVVWDVSGSVRLRLTPLVHNAVMSAFYFDAVPSPAPVTVGARFVKTDLSTKGNWKGVYGKDASLVVRDTFVNAPYATVAATGKGDWTWSSNPTDVRALQKNSDAGRIGACWFSSPAAGPITIDVNITDGKAHQIALYMLDYDNYYGRAASVEIVNAATGAVLDTRAVATYSDGRYLVWDIKGRVKIRVTRTNGPNALVGGLFLDPASAPF